MGFLDSLMNNNTLDLNKALNNSDKPKDYVEIQEKVKKLEEEIQKDKEKIKNEGEKDGILG